jgi:hypothetical protein
MGQVAEGCLPIDHDHRAVTVSSGLDYHPEEDVWTMR